MIALIQRVLEARVWVAADPPLALGTPSGPSDTATPLPECVGQIGPGLLVFVCAEPADTVSQAARMVEKVLKLRIFADEAGKMNRSVQAVGGGLLIVSQFTLAADTTQGQRPSFTGAAPAAQGLALYEEVLALARARHPVVEQGRFGADMRVELVNDGPVTIPLTIR